MSSAKTRAVLAALPTRPFLRRLLEQGLLCARGTEGLYFHALLEQATKNVLDEDYPDIARILRIARRPGRRMKRVPPVEALVSLVNVVTEIIIEHPTNTFPCRSQAPALRGYRTFSGSALSTRPISA